MAQLNGSYEKLAAGYLFPEIAKRTSEHSKANPGTRIMKLGIGNTTEPLTPTVIEGLRQGVEMLRDVATYSGYGDEQGMTKLREAIAAQYQTSGASIDPSEVFVSDGAKPDSANIQSIFGQNNIVAVQDPAYPVYVDTNVIAGRTGRHDSDKNQYGGLVYMACNEANGFFPSVPNKKVDLIYLCSPNNPTGAVATKDQLAGFVKYAKENKAAIIFDAAYASFIKDKEFPKSIYEIEGAKDCAIEINSFSKSHGFTGVRLGWTTVPKAMVVEGTVPGDVNARWNRRQCTFFNGASNVVQQGGLAALSPEGLQESQELVDFYMQNAQIIREGLDEKGITTFGGENAPYVWMKTPEEMTSWDFFDKLLKETNVVGTPGSGFGPSGEGFFRLSAFGHREDIVDAVDSIKNNLKL